MSPLPENRGPDAAQAAEVARQMLALRKRYVEKLDGFVVVIEAALSVCDTGRLGPVVREELRTNAHKLAGTGATYGFPTISTTARALDDKLKFEPNTPESVLKDLIERLYQACLGAVTGVAEAEGPYKPAPTHAGFGRREPSTPVETAMKPRQLPILLAADDDEAILSLFGQIFAGEFDVITARSSDEALKMMRLYRPDIVLLDDIMPDSITGLKFLEFLHRTGEFASTPILMVTASDSEADMERGLVAGATDYITKPFDPVVVSSKVRRLMSLQR